MKNHPESQKIEQGLWRKYRKEASRENREALIMHYLWLVKYICGRIAMELPSRIRAEELLNSGVLGLIEAIEKFDEQHNNLFKTYAFNRIRGAILDELRRLDWAPRLLRKKARDIERIAKSLELQYHRAPSLEEIAAAAGMSVQEVGALMQDVSATALLSLEETLFFNNEREHSPTIMETIEDTKAVNPTRELEQQETRELLAAALQKLPEKLRLVLTLYYYEELTLKEIGQVMDVSESRICQVHAKALVALQKEIKSLRVGALPQRAG
ncbi:MAG: FliA/WhiG family RNA polymerase sigma factor [Candidatus Omnitrophica bacterium]|nr:FliA/WhiG family RNA polymerase sigma factor [Candidatus Omnitrophota bacterium]